MIDNLNILFPEIFLSISIFLILMIGVFLNKSYTLVTNLSLLTLITLILIIFNSESVSGKIFSESFIRDLFANFAKILILSASVFVLYSSQNDKLDGIDIYERIKLVNSFIMNNYDLHEEIYGYRILKRK